MLICKVFVLCDIRILLYFLYFFSIIFSINIKTFCSVNKMLHHNSYSDNHLSRQIVTNIKKCIKVDCVVANKALSWHVMC